MTSEDEAKAQRDCGSVYHMADTEHIGRCALCGRELEGRLPHTHILRDLFWRSEGRDMVCDRIDIVVCHDCGEALEDPLWDWIKERALDDAPFLAEEG